MDFMCDDVADDPYAHDPRVKAFCEDVVRLRDALDTMSENTYARAHVGNMRYEERQFHAAQSSAYRTVVDFLDNILTRNKVI